MVSIIIPIYNRAEVITSTIAACRKIDVPHEIILVNDGSTDQTEQVIKKAITDELNKGIITPKSIPNSGASKARNVGYQLSKGDYILFLDSDDLINPDFISKAVSEFENSKDLDIVYAGYRSIKDGGIDHTSQAIHADKAIEGIISSWITHPSAILYHRRLLESGIVWNETLPAMQDYDFTLRAFTAADTWKRIRMYAVDIREEGSDRISASRFAKHHEAINSQLVDSIRFCKEHYGINTYDEAFRNRVMMYVRNYISAGNRTGLNDLIRKISLSDSDISFPLLKLKMANVMPSVLAKMFLI